MKQLTEQPIFKHLSFATIPPANGLDFVLSPELEAGEPPETRGLPGGAHVTLHAPYQAGDLPVPAGPVRLWIATLGLGEQVERYLERYGFPIRYGYVQQRWPASYYQTVYATELGSAEMPSAG